MARKRPTASDVTRPALTCIDGGLADRGAPMLTRAESEALRRGSPLTHSRLTAHLISPAEAAIRPAPQPPLRAL